MATRRGSTPEQGDNNIGKVFKSLGGFLDLLSELSEAGAELKRSGELGDEKKGVKAVYGFSVRMGGGGAPKVEHFGNVKQAQQGAVVEEVREPIVDVFDEDDHLLVVAELPGVGSGDIRYELQDDVLTLSASSKDRKYRKELLLGSAVKTEGATESHRNGVYELKLPKAL